MARIMVVDDDPFTLNIFTSLLRKNGHTVFSAINGTDCMRQLRTVSVDLAVVDVFMPEMDGIELTKNICRHFPDVKIVGISSKSDGDHLGEMLRNGADMVTQKPLDARDLLSIVRIMTSEG